jgi:hypothetical protein
VAKYNILESIKIDNFLLMAYKLRKMGERWEIDPSFRPRDGSK